MKKKTIKSCANLFSVTVAGYEPKNLNEYLNKVEQDLKQYAKELNLTISCHVEYIPINYNEAIKNQEFEDKRELNMKEMDKLFKFPKSVCGMIDVPDGQILKYEQTMSNEEINNIRKKWYETYKGRMDVCNEQDLQKLNEIKWLQNKIKELRKGKKDV